MPQPMISVHGPGHNDHSGEEIIPLTEIERAAILAVMEAMRGRRDLAAKALGISEETLSMKLDLFGASTNGNL